MKLNNQKILDAANIIAGKAQRGPADYMIVSTELADTMIEILEEREHKRKVRERRLKIEKIRNGTKKS
jgi:hypothetical protein